MMMLWMVLMSMSDGDAAPPERGAVDEVLDALHQAATDADAARYFGLFTEDAVFVGTDATERWDLPAFRAFAEPHFAEAPAWAYTPERRSVSFDARGRTAWFDEALRHERYGEVRGSGVLVRQGRDWRVAQYVLSFPVPNEVAPAVIARIRDHAADAPEPRLPTPYTAAQLRAALPVGSVMVYQHTEGGTVSVHRTEVVAADAERVTFAASADGEEGGRSEHTFTELRDHASFPVAGTAWADEEVTVPLGTLPTRRYTVQGAGQAKTFWFSPHHPGPPVKMTVEAGGVQVFEMVLVERTGG
jgi:hypothetical protein